MERRTANRRKIRLTCLQGLAPLLALLFLAGQMKGQGKVKFTRDKFDFGEIKEEDGHVETVFAFENAGDAPVALVSVKASCGCTTPVWSRDSIPPGSQGFIKVRFNPANRPGRFEKPILVQHTGARSPETLTITGTVIPRPKGPADYYPFEEGNLRFRTNHLTYGTLFKGDSLTRSTVIYNQGDRPVRFSRGRSKVPAHLVPRMTKGSLDPGDTLTFAVTYHAGAHPGWGFLFDNIFLATDDPDKPMKRFNISAEIHDRQPPDIPKARAGRLRIEKVRHDFGTVTEGEMPTAKFALRNSGDHPLLVRKVSATCGCISTAVTADTIPPGGESEVIVTFNSRGRIGKEEKEIVLITNDPYSSKRILRIAAQVRRRD